MIIDHDENREREVQNICTEILNQSIEFYDNPNGPYEFSCPFCCRKLTGGRDLYKKGVKLAEIKHSPNCIYLIAKDLKTH
jgi:hypothetical protein